MRSGAGDETFRRGGNEKWEPRLGGRRIEAATQEVNAGGFGGGGFFRRLDVNMGKAAFAFELAKIVNGVFLIRPEHREDDVAWRGLGARENSRKRMGTRQAK